MRYSLRLLLLASCCMAMNAHATSSSATSSTSISASSSYSASSTYSIKSSATGSAAGFTTQPFALAPGGIAYYPSYQNGYSNYGYQRGYRNYCNTRNGYRSAWGPFYSAFYNPGYYGGGFYSSNNYNSYPRRYGYGYGYGYRYSCGGHH